MFSLEDFHQEYETDTRDIVINGKKFQFFVPGSIERFIDPENPLQDFPLWAKIWHAGTVLAGHLSQIPVETGKRMLEIGSGIGLVGIVAANAGHDVMATDYNAHALDFVRANSLLNNCPHLKVSRLDWNKPHLEDDYDYIIGSEVVYREQDVQLLLKLFHKYLKPDGKIILAEEMRKTISEFYRQMDPFFHVTIRKNILRSDSEENLVLLIEMEPHI